MQIVDMLALLVLFAAGAGFVVIKTSWFNQMRLGVWLLSRARAQREIEAAARAINLEAKIWMDDEETKHLPRPMSVDRATGEVIEQ